MQRYITERYHQFPDWASANSYHEYDHVLVIPSFIKLEDDSLFCENYLDTLSQIKKEKLSLDAQETLIDHQEQLQGILQHVSDKTAFQTDPSLYNVQGPFVYLFQSEYAPLKERLLTINQKMQNVPAYYQVAKDNLTDPTIENTTQAIKDHTKTFFFFYYTLRDSLVHANLSAKEQKTFLRNLNKTQDAIKDYVAYCNSILFEYRDQIQMDSLALVKN